MTVVSMTGGQPPQRERDEELVELLQELLGAAEVGEVVGIAVVSTKFNRDIRTDTCGWVGGDTMIGGLERLKLKLLLND